MQFNNYESLIWFTSLFVMYIASVMTLVEQIDKKQYALAFALIVISFGMLYGMIYLGLFMGMSVLFGNG